MPDEEQVFPMCTCGHSKQIHDIETYHEGADDQFKIETCLAENCTCRLFVGLEGVIKDLYFTKLPDTVMCTCGHPYESHNTYNANGHIYVPCLERYCPCEDFVKAEITEGHEEVEPDNVNHPAHYQHYKGLEVIDFTEQMNFNRGNAVKYIARAGIKNPDTEIEDLEKAQWYITREIERLKTNAGDDSVQ